MKHEILYESAFSAVQCHLEKGESLKAESDAMVSMSTTLDVKGSTGDGGIIGGITRKLLAGESFFFQHITATRGPGNVLLAQSALGGIGDVVLDGTYGLKVQRGSFLAAEDTIEIDTAIQNLTKGLFSGQGFFVLNIHGKGIVFLSACGAIHEIELEAGEEAIIDNGHLVAWPDCMEYKIEKASSEGWLSSFTSGEGLVCHFKGPGTVLIQTRKPEAVSAWLKSMVKFVK